MLFYAQLQQMDEKWTIMGRKWMKYMSISDGKMDNSVAQQDLGESSHAHVEDVDDDSESEHEDSDNSDI